MRAPPAVRCGLRFSVNDDARLQDDCDRDRSMISQVVQEAIEQVVRLRTSVPDHFADDIEFKVAIAVGSPARSEHGNDP
jgi:hypothetical protein